MIETEMNTHEPNLIVTLSKGALWFEALFLPVVLTCFIIVTQGVDFWDNQSTLTNVLILGGFILVLANLALTTRRLRKPPVILECSSDGIRFRGNKFMPWEDMDYIDSNPIFGSITFHPLRGDNITFTGFDAGYQQTRQAIDFVRRVAPKHLTAEL